MPRTKSSSRWLARHVSDPFVKRARSEGSRSRAVYKLEELDRRDRLFRPGMTVIDLGAAPGGFAQYAARRIAPGGRLLAVDLLPMAPLEGIEILQGDISEVAVLESVRTWLGPHQADLVMSDMAPNITGIRAVDEARMEHLAEIAVDFAEQALHPGGALVLKTFQGVGFKELMQRLKAHFKTVVSRKPKASRDASPEMYLLARGYGTSA